MKRLTIILLVLAASLTASFAQQRRNGFYKDIFIDGGINLVSGKDLPSARALGLTFGRFTSSTYKGKSILSDTLLQTKLISGDELDENGVLLYPDGQPRFRMMYVFGGSSIKHGNSVGAKGRDNVRAFVAAGGSYLGSCAGSYLATTYRYREGKMIDRKMHFRLWPGASTSAGMRKTWHGMDIVKKSPLLKYAYFGKDRHVDSVYHNGGNYAWGDLPKGTEVLATYDTKDIKGHENVHGEPNVWAWKENDKSGRVIMCGSHPEKRTKGGNLNLMKAMLLYALDGTTGPVVKAQLEIGQKRSMTARTSDANPAYTRIGDLQYHHFTVNVPAKTEKLTVELTPVKGWENFNLWLFAAPGEFAFNDNAWWTNMTAKAGKSLIIDNPPAGKLYISVYCASTVTTGSSYGDYYVSGVEVLNGVPYEITVK